VGPEIALLITGAVLILGAIGNAIKKHEIAVAVKEREDIAQARWDALPVQYIANKPIKQTYRLSDVIRLEWKLVREAAPDCLINGNSAKGYHVNLAELMCTCEDWQSKRSCYGHDDLRRACKHLCRVLVKHTTEWNCHPLVVAMVQQEGLNGGVPHVVFLITDFFRVDVLLAKNPEWNGYQVYAPKKQGKHFSDEIEKFYFCQTRSGSWYWHGDEKPVGMAGDIRRHVMEMVRYPVIMPYLNLEKTE
jgi:hypothetical protein